MTNLAMSHEFVHSLHISKKEDHSNEFGKDILAHCSDLIRYYFSDKNITSQLFSQCINFIKGVILASLELGALGASPWLALLDPLLTLLKSQTAGSRVSILANPGRCLRRQHRPLEGQHDAPVRGRCSRINRYAQFLLCEWHWNYV